MKTTNITINVGPSGGDCTGPYYIHLKKPMTVKEFITEWLKEYPNEWGYFKVNVDDEPDKIWCNYSHGKIEGDSISDKYLNKYIAKAYGSGGWSNSQFSFDLVQEKQEKKRIPVKACPFCGGTAKLINKHWCNDMQFDCDHDVFYVECTKCKSSGKHIEVKDARYRKTCSEELEKAEDEAIKTWNRRI